MAKPKNPLLSLGATGTIGDALTYQKRGQSTIARDKPTPAYRYTLPQAYQRWLYQDYAYLWTQQSEATKRTYAATGSRFHLTGFQYWMKYQLANLPDIAAMWHLDNISNSSVIDVSKNANHGTVYGASLVDGVIDKALSFDRIDDYVDCGTGPSLSPALISVEFWLNYKTTTWYDMPLSKGVPDWVGGQYDFTFPAAETYLTARIRTTAGFSGLNSPNLTPNVWIHITQTYNGTLHIFYINGLEVSRATIIGELLSGTYNLNLGRNAQSASNLFHGLIDHVIIYNRALDATEIKRHSERRYPP